MESGSDESPSTVTILPGEGTWRSRAVRYVSGNWAAILSVMPEFELLPFAAGDGEPANPFLLTVMRLPLTKAERPVPIAVVSQSYSLAQHREVAALCREAIVATGIEPHSLRYEAGLSEFGEWMNFRIYLPDDYGFTDAYGNKLDLRLECFNSVDGSSRLVILFGWYRFICSNGLVIGRSKIEIKERHGESLNLDLIRDRLQAAFAAVENDRRRIALWQSRRIEIDHVTEWANGPVSEAWGKKAAARVFHICAGGRDVALVDPFAPGPATEKPIRLLARVPGSPERAATKYDVSQALSFVATHRANAEERIAWQAEIPRLLERLPAVVADRRAH